MTTIATAKREEKRESLIELAKTIVLALLIALVIRSALVQPFRIPSGSMQPTLLVGDYIIVSKWSYGYSRFSLPFFSFGPGGRFFGADPERGDVIVFRPPHQPNSDFVKRLIGMPGDAVQMRGGVLHINGEPVQREFLGLQDFRDGQSDRLIRLAVYRETLPNGVAYTTFDRETDGYLDDTPVFRVPEGHYFMMGDDRDGSDDSRQSVGFVPFDHLVGKAQVTFLSFDSASMLPSLRMTRFFKGVE